MWRCNIELNRDYEWENDYGLLEGNGQKISLRSKRKPHETLEWKALVAEIRIRDHENTKHMH